MAASAGEQVLRYRRLAELLHQQHVRRVVLDEPLEWERRANDIRERERRAEAEKR
ncbi:MAG: hypothetical protein JWL84_5268 [Rhodospirillales bacterium]|jgi:hypothetical protein|nr:hypothetical protein [Rhodospirillales bacterium]